MRSRRFSHRLIAVSYTHLLVDRAAFDAADAHTANEFVIVDGRDEHLQRPVFIALRRIDICLLYTSIIRKGDMQVEIDGSRKDCFELVTTKDASEVEDHKIVVCLLYTARCV